MTTNYQLLPYHPIQIHCTKLPKVFGFTHGSGFAAHFLLLLSHFAPAAFVKTLARGGQAQKVVVSVQTTVATGPTVMNRLINDIEREERD